MKQPDGLIERMQNGDEKALSDLYSMYSRALAGVIHAIVKENEATEEVLQDVFTKVWNYRSTYQPGKGRFYTWLLNIARNSAIDRVRSKAYRNQKQNLNPENFVDIVATTNDLNRQTDAIGLREFVRKLPENCVKLIDLIYFKGYTQADTAEALAMPLGTVKTRMRNCIQKLREAVGIEK